MKRAIRHALDSAAVPAKAAFFPRFFKTGPGDYAEGDRFLGVTVPAARAIAKEYREAPLAVIEELLLDPIHEMRLTALLILALQFQDADREGKKAIVDFYLRHLDYVNNWDLVDASAPAILGTSLLAKKDHSVLYRLARSGMLWRERVAIVATLPLIRAGESEDTMRIATILLQHPHDLIHKAVGWMLREVGKRDPAALHAFLDLHATVMPRTMLRSAIERLPRADRARRMQR